MTETEVREAYTKRTSEYIWLFGSVDRVNEQDRWFVAHWAKSLRGPVVGCGPGYWTAFLTGLDADAEGSELVPALVQDPKARSPIRISESRRSLTSGSTTSTSEGSSPSMPS